MRALGLSRSGPTPGSFWLAGGAYLAAFAVLCRVVPGQAHEAAPIAAESGAADVPVTETAPPRAPARPASEMVLVPAGTYQPFYKDEAGGKPIPVPPFLLDVAPVRRGEFLEFVRAEPRFRKSRIDRLFAEPAYLADWPGDLDPGPSVDEPVTFVSWFAAKAYCEHVGKRLPSTSEWERTAGRSAELSAAAPASGHSPFRFAMGKAEADAAGVRGFGSAWEWTSDFNSTLVSGRLGDSDGAASSAFCGDGVRATDPSDYGAFLRYSFRASLKADYALKRLGFRCAKPAS